MLKIKPIEFKTKAEEFRNSNAYKFAVREYLNALMLDKSDFELYLGLGISYKFLNKTDKAIAALEKAVSLNKESASAFYELGICYLITGQVCQAIYNLRQSILLDKTNLNAQIQLGLAHEAIEEPDMALLIYKTIIERHPYYVRAYEQSQFLLMGLERYQEAGQILSKLIKIFPECTHAYLGMGICFEKMGNMSGAKRFYKKFLDLTDDKEQIKMVSQKLKNFSEVKKNNPLKLVSV